MAADEARGAGQGNQRCIHRKPPDGTAKRLENQADENDACGERRDLHNARGPEECHSGEAGEGKVEPEHMGADLERREAVVGGLW